MTLTKRTMIMGSLLAVFVVTGMSGIAYSEKTQVDFDVLYDKQIKLVPSCEELKYPSGEVYAVRESTEKMRVDFGVWLQDKSITKQSYKIGFDFPETIYKHVKTGDWGFTGDRCEVLKTLQRITYTTISSELNGSDTIYTCDDRGWGNLSKLGSITSDNPLTDTVHGFPSTNGLVDVQCYRDPHIGFEPDSDHRLLTTVYYVNPETDEQSKYQFDYPHIELPIAYVEDVDPLKWD
jgi:hypothetical protein